MIGRNAHDVTKRQERRNKKSARDVTRSISRIREPLMSSVSVT